MSTRSPGQPPTCSLPSREVVDAKAIHGVVPQKRVALDERQAKQIELSRVGGRSPSAVSQADPQLRFERTLYEAGFGAAVLARQPALVHNRAQGYPSEPTTLV